jgi:hypothetical protein
MSKRRTADKLHKIMITPFRHLIEDMRKELEYERGVPKTGIHEDDFLYCEAFLARIENELTEETQ